VTPVRLRAAPVVARPDSGDPPLGKQPPRDLGDAIRELVLKKDPRYTLEAYRFVYEALDHTIQKIGERRHVTGRELLEGIRELAHRRFGPLAKTVFGCWNIRSTSDFGAIVFNLVEAGLMSKTEEDSRDDFQNGFDFDAAFPVEI
jgi:uncharacterized repeat protein (TIGR04138 family)